MVLLLLLVSGFASYNAIPKESQPDISIPFVTVSVHHEGISPEDAIRLIVRPLETELQGLEGLKEMTSSAVEGNGYVTLEFEAGYDIDTALQDVRAAVNIAEADLPEESDEPVVNEINASDMFPMIVVNLSGDVPVRTLIQIARDLQDELEAFPEVLEVVIGGDREDVVDVVVDPYVYDNYNISAEELFAFVGRNNQLVAAGAIDTGVGRMPVKVPGLFEDLEDILALPIKAENDRVIEVEDLATVQKTFKDAEEYARVNGQPAVTLEVKKRAGENIISAVQKIRAQVAESSQLWPEGIEYSFTQDQSEEIKVMLSDLQNNVLSAVILVMVVIIAILGMRTAVLVGVAIPGSFLTGILVLDILDLTMNIVVLFSLIMATGMLVDGAIVVTELADRKMNEGKSRFDAYLIAAKRMAQPIIASTITTLVAFMPLLFWPGMVGEFMKYLPITLICTLSASLFMAMGFVPTLGSIFGQPGPASKSAMRSLAAAEGGNLDELHGLTGVYVRVLRRLLKAPIVVVLVAIFAFLGSIFLYTTFGKGIEFFPDVDPERAQVQVRMRGNLSIDEIDSVMREVENRIIDIDGIETVYTRSSVGFRGGGGQDLLEDTHGLMQIEFLDWWKRRSGKEIIEEMREKTADIPGILIDIAKQEAGPPVGKPVRVELYAPDEALLIESIALLREKFESMEDLQDIVDSRPVPGIDWVLDVDRSEAARYGADVTMVGNLVQFVTTGLVAGSYRPDDSDNEVDIRLRYPLGSRELSQLEDLRVNVAGVMIPITNFVERKPEPKVGTINRTEAKQMMYVGADVELQPQAAINNEALREWLIAEEPFDSRVEWRFRGEDEEQREAQAFLGKAFAVALSVMAIVLVTQFNNFYQAFLILTAVVFSTLGVFLGLLLTHQPFGIIMNGIGVISLAGIVVNNNIVLIDTFVHLHAQGMSTMDAVLRTAAQRLRPVMLTTVTTILGLMPMVLSMNIDIIGRDISFGAPSTQWWVQLATSVAFGLAFATLLTLVLTPALLVLREHVSNIFRKA